MQYQIIINIPEQYNDYVRSIEDFEQFVVNATVQALKTENDACDRKKRLSDAAKLMLTNIPRIRN